MKRFLTTAMLLSSVTVAVAQEAGDGEVDRVWLRDGSLVTGELQEFGDEGLVIETDFAGELTLNREVVEGVTAAERMAVEMPGGERVVGRLVYDADQQTQQVEETAFGDVVLEQGIAAMWAEDEQPPAEREMAEQEQAHEQRVEQVEEEYEQQLITLREEHEEEVAALRETQPGLGTNWSARLELGLNGATGNTERIGFRGRARATRETDYDRLNLHLGGEYSKEGGEETANEVYGGAGLEVDLSERMFTFIRTELERDEFEDLELRNTTTGGLGYFVFDEEDHQLKVRGGAGFQYESYRNGVSDSDVVLELGLDYEVVIHPWLTFTHGTTLYPSVEDVLNDYRVVSETAGEVPIGDSEQWSLRAGMRNKYNAMPQPGVERLDTTYFLDVVYDWD